MQDVRGKVAVVTGAASGLGLAIATELAGRGAKLVLSDIEAGALAAAVDKVSATGAEAIGVAADVGDEVSVNRLADASWARFKTVDIVVHNAGVVVFNPVTKTTQADWKWLLHVNLWGPVNGVAAFLPRMLASDRDGCMLFTSSYGGLVAYPDTGAYAATKAAVLMMVETLALENQDSKIKFSALCPMHVATNIITSNRNRPDNFGGPTANLEGVQSRKRGLHSTIATPEDVARLTIDGMLRGDLYIQTHKSGEAHWAARNATIAASFARAP